MNHAGKLQLHTGGRGPWRMPLEASRSTPAVGLARRPAADLIWVCRPAAEVLPANSGGARGRARHMAESRSRESAATGGDVGAVPENAGSASNPPAELMRLINGYQISQALHVAATLGVADHPEDGPKPCDALARACGAHPPSLYRLLRALAAVGVFRETGGKTFSLTPLGFCLTGGAPGSRRDYARWMGTPGQWRPWGDLLHSVRSGEGAAR